GGGGRLTPVGGWRIVRPSPGRVADLGSGGEVGGLSEILEDFSPRALVEAIEANLFAYAAHWAGSSLVEVQDRPEALCLISDVPSPWVNFIFRARLDPAALDPAIEGLLDLFLRRNLPVPWWAGPA